MHRFPLHGAYTGPAGHRRHRTGARGRLLHLVPPDVGGLAVGLRPYRPGERRGSALVRRDGYTGIPMVTEPDDPLPGHGPEASWQTPLAAAPPFPVRLVLLSAFVPGHHHGAGPA